MAYKNTITGETREEQPKQYRARYDGKLCLHCDKKISVGEFIAWPRSGAHKKRPYHTNCSDPMVWPWIEVSGDTPKPIPSACSECGNIIGDPKNHDYTCSRYPKPPRNEQAYANCGIHSPGDKDCSFTDYEALCANCGARAGEHIGAYPHNLERTNCPAFKHAEAPALPDFDAQGESPMHEMEIPNDEANPTIPDSKPIPAPSVSGNTGDGLLDLISAKVQENVVSNVQDRVNRAMEHIDKVVAAKLDKLSIPSIILKRAELPDIKIHNVHKQFKDVLQLLNAGEYVYLHGAPGGHKSSIGPQLAEALGVRYGYMSLCEQTPEYVVRGYMSPISKEYVEPPFINFLRNGGLWAWEEADNSNDNLRNGLNTALEQRLVCLDNGDTFPIHKDFYMIANGNTCGRGAHPAFPSRTSFDAAFAARFVFVEFQYDWSLCKHIALGLNDQSLPIVKWAEKVSNFALAQGIQLVMSPREVYKLAKLTKLTDLTDEALLDGILRGLDVPSKEKILSNYPFPKIARS